MKNLLKYSTLEEFRAAQGTSGFVENIIPGIALVVDQFDENVKIGTHFNDPIYFQNTSMTIYGSSVLTASTASYAALCDGYKDSTSFATWSITNGSAYATIANGGILTILTGANNSSITIRATYGQLVAEKDVTVTYLAGSETETTIETVIDESGNTNTVITTTTTNEDNSYTSNATTYDSNENPKETIAVSGDSVGNVDTRDTVYDASGNSEVVSYSIDTTGSGGSGKTVSNGVNTEFIPFDGSSKGFVCHLRFNSKPGEQPNPPVVVDTEDTGSNYLFNIFSAQDPYRPWGGLMFRWALPKTNYTSSSGRLVLQYIDSAGKAFNIHVTSANSAVATAGDFDITISYDPNLTVYSKKLIITDNLNSTVLKSVDIEFGDNNLDFTLGYAISQAGTPYRYANVTFYDFSITKL